METESLEVTSLPENLRHVSFEELRNLMNKCSSKNFDSIDGAAKNSNKTKEYHRENKNRPREISSKIPLSKTKLGESRRTEMQKLRDPRFHHKFGAFDQNIFEKNYKFLNNIKKKEKKLLLKQLQDPNNADDEREKIRLLLQRMENQRKEMVKKKEEKKLTNVERNYQLQRLKEGHKPQYSKKSDKKLLNLVRNFETLKEKGGLQKHIKRRRKKIDSKDKKKMNISNNVR